MCRRWKINSGGVADDAIFAKTGSGAWCIVGEFAREGIYFDPAQKGDRVSGWQSMRRLSGHRYQARVRTLEIRFSPHLVATDGDELRYIYFHEKGMQCDPEEARLTLEFGYWVLRQNGVEAKPHQFELFDLFSGKYFQGQPVRTAHALPVTSTLTSATTTNRTAFGHNGHSLGGPRKKG